MAQDIKRGTYTESNQSTYVVTKTFSHTNDGSDVLVRIMLHGNGVLPTGFSVTYNGTAMTSLASAYDGINYNCVLIFYLKNASSGANNVVVNWTNQAKGAVTALSLTGVAAYRTTPGTYGGGTTISITANTAPGDLVLDAVVYWSSPLTTLTVGAGQTQEKNTTLTDTHVGNSYGPASSSGSTTAMTWTLGSSRTWLSVVVALYGAEVGGVAVSPLYWI